MRRLRLAAVVSLAAVALAASVRIYVEAQVPRYPARWPIAYQWESDKVKWNLTDDLTFIPDDYNGVWINIRDGYRVTVSQPERYTATLYLVGSSTVLSAGVVDGDSLPSQVQRLTTRWRVVNVGMPGASAVHQYTRLKYLPIAPGDVVVFYDGQVDFESDSGAAMVERYRRYVALAQQYTVARGAAFFHVLQPHVYTLQPQSWEWTRKHEQVGRMYKDWALMQRSETGLDLTHALDKCRLEGACFYLDGHHVNARANAGLARLIYDYVTTF